MTIGEQQLSIFRDHWRRRRPVKPVVQANRPGVFLNPRRRFECIREGRDSEIVDLPRCRGLAELRIEKLALYTPIVRDRIFEAAAHYIAEFVGRGNAASGRSESIEISEPIVSTRISETPRRVDEEPVERDT